jgi:hypothetical protein
MQEFYMYYYSARSRWTKQQQEFYVEKKYICIEIISPSSADFP